MRICDLGFDFGEVRLRRARSSRRAAICNLRSARAILLCAVIGLSGCSGAGLDLISTTRPAAAQRESDRPDLQADWKQIAQALGKGGESRAGVYTVTFPRDDLLVSIEQMDVPTGAGIESVVHFYRCSCGKTAVIGQFVLADYEANDVVYALQKQDIVVSSVGPFLLYEKPRLLEVRFQAEGTPRHLAEAIRSALDWIGPNRTAPHRPDVSYP